MRKVHNAQVILIGAAGFRGSAPFGGAFEVAEADTCIAVDSETGAGTVTVLCRCVGDSSQVEELVFELEDRIPQLVIGFAGDVVDCISVC